MFIRSERLFLRPAWPEERTEFLTLVDDEAVAHRFAEAIWPHDSGPDPVRPSGFYPQFLVTVPESTGARVIGAVSFAARDLATEIACWIAPAFRNCGHALEALGAAMAIARTIGHQRVVPAMCPDNTQCTRVCEGHGSWPSDRSNVMWAA